MKRSGYMTRAMTAQDPRFRRVLAKLGHAPMGAIEGDQEAQSKPAAQAKPKAEPKSAKRGGKTKPEAASK